MLLKIRNEKGEWIGVDVIKGEPGKDGTMKFEELTEEQKAELKGEPGRDGVDGAPGKDGYTPIKGVDYFDGVNGKDGVDGKDGINGTNGKDGVDGKDYILTDADKQEIAAMVDVPEVDVDLTDYYTKEEIDDLLANLPTGEALPSAEEVEF